MSTPMPLLLPLLLVAGMAVASPPAAAPAGAAAEVEALLLRLADSDRLDAGSDFTVSRPARTVYELGAVVAGGDPAPVVLAVTPSGAAERMGVRAGDRLLSANGRSLAGRAQPASWMQQALAEQDGTLRLQVLRGRERLQLHGRATAVPLPAYQLIVGAGAGTVPGCGRITSFDALPRTQRLFPVKVIAIDGVTAGPSTSNTYRVDAGRHELTLAEAIDSREFNAVSNAMRSRKHDRYKTLAVDVGRGQTLQLAARLLPESRTSVASGGYWEPTVYRVVPESCQ